MDAALLGALTKVIEHYEGGADLEANKTATIDVSQYSGAVEITPTSGNDAMKKATVTLSNIPAGGVSTLYCWYDSTNDNIVYTLSDTPSVNDIILIGGGESGIGGSEIRSEYKVDTVDGNTLTTDYSSDYTYTRYQTGDISLS